MNPSPDLDINYVANLARLALTEAEKGKFAQQLGDTPDDAQAIADYFWTKLYPQEQTEEPAYWSAQCRPGGALDERPPGSTMWP